MAYAEREKNLQTTVYSVSGLTAMHLSLIFRFFKCHVWKNPHIFSINPFEFFLSFFLSFFVVVPLQKYEFCSAMMRTPPLERTHQELSFEWS